MIATLTGIVAEKLGEHVILEVRGVGYGVFVPTEDYGRIQIGDQAKLYIYEHIREVSHDLFGFTTIGTKALFEQLLGVNGVGPKMALNIMGVGTANEVRAAIAGGDTKFIQAASGVGKKVAERVVVELKDKVGLVTSAHADAVLFGSTVSQQDEAVQALVALGYTLPDAVAALSSVDTGISTEERIKQALKGTAL